MPLEDLAGPQLWSLSGLVYMDGYIDSNSFTRILRSKTLFSVLWKLLLP